MKTPSLSFLLLVLVCASAAKAVPLYEQIVSFGDSLTDMGQDYNPAGTSNQNPQSLSVYPNQKWSKFLAGPQFLEIENNPTYIWNPASSQIYKPSGTQATGFKGGTNYAVTGNTSAGLPTQVGLYLNPAFNTSGVDTDALHTLWIGGNDIQIALLTPTNVSTNNMAPVDLAVTRCQQQIELLISAGVTDFLWLNLPDLSKTPYIMANASPAAEAYAHNLTIHFNEEMALVASELRAENPGITLFELDVFTLFEEIQASPSSYGFSNVTDAYPGRNTGISPDLYLFNADGFHPSPHAHYLVAQAAYGVLAVPEPSTSFLLLSGLLGLGLVRRRKNSAWCGKCGLLEY